MLIYLVLAAELAVLYTVFWYLYLYEPRPVKLAGNSWGRYGQRGFTAGGIDPTLPWLNESARSAYAKGEHASTRPRLNTLPAWLTGNPQIMEEFLQAARLFCQGELAGTSEVDSEESLKAYDREGRMQMRRLGHRRKRMLRVVRDCRRAARAHARLPVLARLLTVFNRTLARLGGRLT